MKAMEPKIKNRNPKSKYELDKRPHFALMGEEYKNEDPDSEEELWFPIKINDKL